MGFFFFISSLVILCRDDYLHGDLNINRFILLVLMFAISMIVIIRPNMIRIFLGWDGLHLVSYCLVIYQHVYPYNAGMLTVVSNWTDNVAVLKIIA
jgi:NADH-ubiquinone oxidoreductase chain 5